MTLLFIWPELPDSSFLGSSIFKKKKKKSCIDNTSFRGYLIYWKLQCCISDGEGNCGRPRTQKSERSHSLWNERIIESWWCHTGQTRMYRAGLYPPFPIEWKRGPSGNSYAVYCFIIYLWCIWTTWTASILLNILYFIFYDSECLTVNKLEIKWSFQNTINISEIFPARDSSSLSDDKGNL